MFFAVKKINGKDQEKVTKVNFFSWLDFKSRMLINECFNVDVMIQKVAS
jgi:hypothetical protein